MVAYDYSKLKGLMKKQRWTITLLANNVGLSRVTLSNKLNQGGNFSQKQIEDISEVLKIPPSKYYSYFFEQKVIK